MYRCENLSPVLILVAGLVKVPLVVLQGASWRVVVRIHAKNFHSSPTNLDGYNYDKAIAF